MENLEKLNYNPEEWYIAGKSVEGQDSEKTQCKQKRKKRQSKLFYILFGVVVIGCVIIWFAMCNEPLYLLHPFVEWECALISGSIGVGIIIIMWLVDRTVMKKCVNKNEESNTSDSETDVF